MCKNIIMFAERDQIISNYEVLHKQNWKEKPERRTGESPQLYFSIADSWSRSDRSFYYSIVMRDQKSTIGFSTKFSNGSSAAASRNEELFKIIDEYFNYSGLGEPVRNLGTLLNCFLTTQEGDEVGYAPSFLNEITYEVTRLNAFLALVYEQREFIKRKEVCHG
jgi:hypothetical protein